MIAWSKAFRATALTLLVILVVVIAIIFASKSDFHFHTGGTFSLKIEPTPYTPQYSDPI